MSMFSFITLTPGHLDNVVTFLHNNYQKDPSDPIQIQYSRDFIYWHLRQIKDGLAIGICYKNKLIGMITCLLIPSVVNGEHIDLPFPNFLCVRHGVRKTRACRELIGELKRRLTELGYEKVLFSTSRDLDKPNIAYQSCIIPINIPKLYSVGFLSDDDIIIDKYDTNPFKLMRPKYISQISTLLNKTYKSYDLKPFFDSKLVHQTLLPKKDIVLSFVTEDARNFVSVYLFKMWCLESKKYITTANLAFIAITSMEFNLGIKYLIDKLSHYDVDQLLYQMWGENQKIDVTRFTTDGETKYYTHGFDAKSLVFYPI